MFYISTCLLTNREQDYLYYHYYYLCYNIHIRYTLYNFYIIYSSWPAPPNWSTLNVSEVSRWFIPGLLALKIDLLWRHPVPVFDIVEKKPFPQDYVISAEEEENLRHYDIEIFPYDVPDELIRGLIAEDEDEE